MTPKTFFILILKVLGIFIFLNSLIYIPQLIEVLRSFSDLINSEFNLGIFFLSILLLLLIACYFYLLYVFVFKTDWIVEKYSLDKHIPEEKIDFTLHRSSLLSIALIVIGGVVFINSFPEFCLEIYTYLGRHQYYQFLGDNPTVGWILFYGIKTFFSILLVTNTRFFVNLIEKQRKK